MPKQETTLDDVLQAVSEGFNQVQEQFNGMRADFDQRFDRIEKLVYNWPAPSTIHDMLVLTTKLKQRVDALEKKLGMQPQ